MFQIIWKLETIINPFVGTDAILRGIETCPVWHDAIVRTFEYSLGTVTQILYANEGVNNLLSIQGTAKMEKLNN